MLHSRNYKHYSQKNCFPLHASWTTWTFAHKIQFAQSFARLSLIKKKKKSKKKKKKKSIAHRKKQAFFFLFLQFFFSRSQKPPVANKPISHTNAQKGKRTEKVRCKVKKKKQRNDPSAGSPTDALLRLLFPLNHTVRLSFRSLLKASPSNSQRSSSVRATGGVYKGQGHIPGGLLNHDPYKAFLVKTETNNCNGLSPPWNKWSTLCNYAKKKKKGRNLLFF